MGARIARRCVDERRPRIHDTPRLSRSLTQLSQRTPVARNQCGARARSNVMSAQTALLYRDARRSRALDTERRPCTPLRGRLRAGGLYRSRKLNSSSARMRSQFDSSNQALDPSRQPSSLTNEHKPRRFTHNSACRSESVKQAQKCVCTSAPDNRSRRALAAECAPLLALVAANGPRRFCAT